MIGWMITEKLKMGMVTIRQDSMFSQVVFEKRVVISTILEAPLASGVLLRAQTTTSPGPTTCPKALPLFTDSAISPLSRVAPLFVASGTTIWWVGIEGGENFFQYRGFKKI
jgi:hypothetical protein